MKYKHNLIISHDTMYFLSFILLLLICCDEKTKSYLVNPTDTYLTYKLNFQSLNPGNEKYSLLLSWSKYPTQENNPLIDYNIVVNPTNNPTTFSTYDTTINLVNLNPGEFYSIIMQISPQLNDTLLSHTKPMTKVKWIANNAEGNSVTPSFDFTENYLEWENVSDIDIDSLFVYFYNSNANYPENTNLDEWHKITSLGANSTQYTHQKDSFNNNYCYLVISSDLYGNTRKSYIACDYTTELTNPLPINIESASSIFKNKIIIRLNLYNESDFESYILWRSSYETMESPNKIVESTNLSQITIDDRNNVIDNYYYYQVQTINQYGISSFGNIVGGGTLP